MLERAEALQPERSGLSPSLAAYGQHDLLFFLGLSLFICKMGIMMVPALLCGRDA